MKAKVHYDATIEVTVNRKKFTAKFLADFRKMFYNFTCINDHLEHLAQLHARGLADNHSFIEGYGQAKDMGITFKTVYQHQYVIGTT